MVTGISVDELIQEVVVSPLLPENEAEAIEKVIRLRLKEGQVPVTQSKLIVRSPASYLVMSMDERSYGTTDDEIDLSDLPQALRAL